MIRTKRGVTLIVKSTRFTNRQKVNGNKDSTTYMFSHQAVIVLLPFFTRENGSAATGTNMGRKVRLQTRVAQTGSDLFCGAFQM